MLRDGGQILPIADRCPSTGTKHAGNEAKALCSQRGGDREITKMEGATKGPQLRWLSE